MISCIALYTFLTATTLQYYVFPHQECIYSAVYDKIPQECSIVFEDFSIAEQLMFGVCASYVKGPFNITIAEINESPVLLKPEVFYISASNADFEVKMTLFNKVRICIIDVYSVCADFCYEEIQDSFAKFFGTASNTPVFEVVSSIAREKNAEKAASENIK